MENYKTKTGIKVLIVVLLFWNIFLSFKVYNIPQPTETPNGEPSSTIINQTSSYTTTDLTKAADKSSKKAVGIRSATGAGSGVIYRSEKLDNGNTKITIITNNHVVAGSSEVMVLFANEQEILGDVVGGDVYTDLAVVNVEADFAVDAFSIGDSSTIKVGEWVLAIGSPLGFDFYGSVSEGIVSGKDRRIGVDLSGDGNEDWDMTVLQTTAAINPGNSGGPLINLNGDLIGINSMKIISSNVEGMGFAIPINEVIPIINQLIETGEVKRPLIGISGRGIAEYSSAHKSYLGLPLDIEKGVVVIEVLKKSAASEAGILPNDIVVEFNGVDIINFKDFRIELYKMKTGDEVLLKVIRDNKIVEITVTLKWLILSQ